jgi:hypothetical protein
MGLNGENCALVKKAQKILAVLYNWKVMKIWHEIAFFQVSSHI